MSEKAQAVVFFQLPEALPRGQHGLSREQVQNVQRERLLRAFAELLAADPLVARGSHAEMRAMGPETGRRQERALREFAEGRMRAERRLRRTDRLLQARPFTVHLGTVHVVRALAREALEAVPEPDFDQLCDDLVQWFVASWYGAEPLRSA